MAAPSRPGGGARSPPRGSSPSAGASPRRRWPSARRPGLPLACSRAISPAAPSVSSVRMRRHDQQPANAVQVQIRGPAERSAAVHADSGVPGPSPRSGRSGRLPPRRQLPKLGAEPGGIAFGVVLANIELQVGDPPGVSRIERQRRPVERVPGPDQHGLQPCPPPPTAPARPTARRPVPAPGRCRRRPRPRRGPRRRRTARCPRRPGAPAPVDPARDPARRRAGCADPDRPAEPAGGDPDAAPCEPRPVQVPADRPTGRAGQPSSRIDVDGTSTSPRATQPSAGSTMDSPVGQVDGEQPPAGRTDVGGDQGPVQPAGHEHQGLVPRNTQPSPAGSASSRTPGPSAAKTPQSRWLSPFTIPARHPGRRRPRARMASASACASSTRRRSGRRRDAAQGAASVRRSDPTRDGVAAIRCRGRGSSARSASPATAAAASTSSRFTASWVPADRGGAISAGEGLTPAEVAHPP